MGAQPVLRVLTPLNPNGSMVRHARWPYCTSLSYFQPSVAISPWTQSGSRQFACTSRSLCPSVQRRETALPVGSRRALWKAVHTVGAVRRYIALAQRLSFPSPSWRFKRRALLIELPARRVAARHVQSRRGHWDALFALTALFRRIAVEGETRWAMSTPRTPPARHAK